MFHVQVPHYYTLHIVSLEWQCNNSHIPDTLPLSLASTFLNHQARTYAFDAAATKRVEAEGQRDPRTLTPTLTLARSLDVFILLCICLL